MLKFYSSLEKLNEKNESRTIFENIIIQIKDYAEYQFHRCVSKGQKKIFKSQILDINLLENSILIAMDFKQKIVSNFYYFKINFYFNQKI